jgi:hypothetical protein
MMRRSRGDRGGAAAVFNRTNPEPPMRNLIVWIAGAVTVISVSTARPGLLGEISVAVPTLTDPDQPVDPDRDIGRWLRHAHVPLFTS